MRLIVPSVTTIGLTGSSWGNKITEIAALDIPSVGLFLTCLSAEGRKDCYKALAEMQQKHFFTIPFVHATSTMCEGEYWYLIKNFKTEYFNLHPSWEFPLEHTLSAKIRQKILIENSASWKALTKHDLSGFAGLCIDLSHLEDARKSVPEVFEENVALMRQFPVLANHISAVSKNVSQVHEGYPLYSVHDLTHGSIDYLSMLPPEAVSNLCAIELENSLAVQKATIKDVTDCFLSLEQKIAA